MKYKDMEINNLCNDSFINLFRKKDQIYVKDSLNKLRIIKINISVVDIELSNGNKISELKLIYIDENKIIVILDY